MLDMLELEYAGKHGGIAQRLIRASTMALATIPANQFANGQSISCSSLVAILIPTAPRYCWLGAPQAHREPQSVARRLSFHIQPGIPPNRVLLILDGLSLLCYYSPQNACGSTLIDFGRSPAVTQITHSGICSQRVQNALHQCRCAPCALSRRRGSGSHPVCLTRILSHATLSM